MKFNSAALLVLLASALVSCGKDEKKPQESAIAQYDLQSAYKVQTQEIAAFKPVGAVFTSQDEIMARAMIAGKLVRKLVDEGSLVKAGQTIAVIDEARFGAEVAAANAAASAMPAQIDAAAAQAKKAQADYERTKSLYDQGVYAKARLDMMSAAMEAANANLASAKANKNAAYANAAAVAAMRAQGRIIAPKSGIVTSAPIPQGSVVMPGEIIATISSGDKILRSFAPESDVQNLKIGGEVNLLDENGAIIGKTIIKKIYPSVQNGNVEIELDANSVSGFVNQRVNIALPVSRHAALTIPIEYLITREGSDFVTLLRESKPLEIPVQRGMAALINGKAGVEILSGLMVNDVIILPKKAGK